MNIATLHNFIFISNGFLGYLQQNYGIHDWFYRLCLMPSLNRLDYGFAEANNCEYVSAKMPK